jgi:hypothetical protein
VKTIRVRVGTQTAIFSLEKETLVHRKLAMAQMKAMRTAAKGYLSQLQKITVPPSPGPVLAWDIEMPHTEFDNDMFDEQDFDSEFPISLPENPVTHENDMHTRESAHKEASGSFASAGRDVRSGWITKTS